MYTITIQNTDSETVINNVPESDLAFWGTLLANAAIQGEVVVTKVEAAS